jgi:hypothetical protein
MTPSASSPLPTRPLRTFEDLPGPRGVPVFGNLVQVEASRIHLQLERWCEVFGPVYRLSSKP